MINIKTSLCLLLFILSCLPATAVDVDSGVVFNFTDTSIITGAAHSWTSLAVHSDHIKMGSDAFAVDPANQITIWNWIWGDEITYNASCTSGNVWFNVTNATWGDGTVNVYVNDTLNDTISASSGTVRFLYDGGWSEKYFRFEPMGDTPTYTVHLTAFAAGASGNSITTNTTCGDASFGAVALTGGADGSDNYWADTQTGASMWGDMGDMISLVVLVLIMGVLIGAIKSGIDIKVVVGFGGGLLMLVAIFSIAPGIGSDMQDVVNLDPPTHATGRLTFVPGGSVTDGETITINATVLEYDLVGDGVTAGRVEIDISDATAATASLNLTEAINNNATLATIVTAARGTT